MAIQETNAKWVIPEEEKKKYIKALAEELPSLRVKVGVPQDELARIIGVSRQTYGAIERRVREMSWSSYLSLILFFDSHNATHKLRPHGTGIPLLAGTGRVADCPKAEARNCSNCMPGIAIGVFYRLYLKRTVPDADSVLEVEA